MKSEAILAAVADRDANFPRLPGREYHWYMLIKGQYVMR